MYLVVSRWEALPGKRDEFERIGREISAMMRAQPGVLFLEAIRDGDTVTTVHGYADSAAYERIVNDPAGPFAAALAKHNVNEVARWIDSTRGETVAH